LNANKEAELLQIVEKIINLDPAMRFAAILDLNGKILEGIMKENKTFVITYTKLDGESVTRNGKWTDKCKEFIAKQGHKCLTYIDLDNNNDYRMATNKITDWNIKWN